MPIGTPQTPANKSASQLRSFGIEEEYLLLEEDTGMPADLASELQKVALAAGFTADREFLSCQLETSTPVCTQADEATAALRKFRTQMSQAAAQRSVTLSGTGLPPVGGELTGAVTPQERYLQISPMLRRAGWHHYSTGMHIHVGVPNEDLGVEVMARVARWMPALMALSANSPIWKGKPTGFASWRHLQGIAWPVADYPPFFDDAAHYNHSVKRLIDSQIILDDGVVNWSARLSRRFPTVEFRFADAQLRESDSVALALILRALVDRSLSEAQAGVPRPELDLSLVRGAMWCAARDGLVDTIVDPHSGERVHAYEFVGLMLKSVDEELERFGDTARVQEYVARRIQDGGPARLQLRRLENSGVAGLVDLYQSELTA